MSKYQLEQIREQAVEAIGGTEVEFEFQGETYSFPHPSFATDEWNEEFLEHTGSVENARFLLGDEQYEKFKAAGGQTSDIGLMLVQVQRDSQAAMVDGSPTRSGTSSVSSRKQSKRR